MSKVTEIMKTTTLNELYVKINSIKNLFEVLLQSMNYCQENDIITYNNNELVEEIRQKLYSLMDELDSSLTVLKK